MSEFLATSPALPGEAATVEGRLADIIEMDDAVVQISEYKLSQSDRARLIAALRLAAAATAVIPLEATPEMVVAGELAGMAYLADAKSDMLIRDARPTVTAEIYRAMVKCALAMSPVSRPNQRDTT